MHSVEYPITLSMSHVNPHDVDELLAGWESDVASGYVVKLRTGRYAYIYSLRRVDYVESKTWRFDAEPTHLYSRGVKWLFGQELLDAIGNTTIAVSQAKYPRTRVDIYLTGRGLGELAHRLPTSPTPDLYRTD